MPGDASERASPLGIRATTDVAVEPSAGQLPTRLEEVTELRPLGHLRLRLKDHFAPFAAGNDSDSSNETICIQIKETVPPVPE